MSSGGLFEHINEPSSPMTGGEILDHVIDYQLLKKEFVPWIW
jgi:hypothetical protein